MALGLCAVCLPHDEVPFLNSCPWYGSCTIQTQTDHLFSSFHDLLFSFSVNITRPDNRAESCFSLFFFCLYKKGAGLPGGTPPSANLSTHSFWLPALSVAVVYWEKKTDCSPACPLACTSMRSSKRLRVQSVQGRRPVRPEVADLARACSLAATGVHPGAAGAMRLWQSAQELGLNFGVFDEIGGPLSLCDAPGI